MGIELKNNLKKGDILVEQFGYSMILFNFFKVLSVKGNNVQLYPLEHTSSAWTGWFECEVKPIDTKGYLTKKIINKRFNKFGEIRIDKNSLFKYDSTRKYIENHAD